MRSWTYVWRQHLRAWLPPLLVLLLALALSLLYRLAFAGEAEFRQQRFQQRSADLVQLVSERERLEELVARVQVGQADLDRFFNEHLATEEQRLTEVIDTVKKLSRRAGLVPSAINYERQELERQQVLKRTIVFTVEGGYMPLRKLLNSLELMEQFVTLEEVTLSGVDGGMLRINLRIATYFLEDEHPAAVAGGAP